MIKYIPFCALLTACPLTSIQTPTAPTPVVTATATPIPTVSPTPTPTLAPIKLQWEPIPQEDEINGDNNNAYNAAINHPTQEESQRFIEEISGYAIKHTEGTGVPASVVVAMAANESGFGFTRVGNQANSIFSQKNWGCEWKSRYSNSCYALIGQPDEYNGYIKVIKKTKRGVIYDESNRPDNKYFAYPSREIAVKALVQEWIVEGQYPPYQKGKYTQTITTYKANITKGMSRYDASIFFIRQLADLGYMHQGGDVYVRNLKPIIDKYNLTRLDK